MNRYGISGDGDLLIEERLRSALRAEADRCAAGEPPRLADACAAIPRSPVRSIAPYRRAAWIAAGAAAAAVVAVLLLPKPLPERPEWMAGPAVRPATPAEIERLHDALPKLPPVPRPPPPRRLVATRPPPPDRTSP